MSRRRKEAPMPASALGLMMFFERDISKFRVKPIYVIIAALGFIITSGILLLFS